MINLVKMEYLKTKKTSIRWTMLAVPILSVTIVFLVFMRNSYTIQSLINQWGLIWANLLIALITGLINHNEMISTQYKSILSSPVNLFKYSISRTIISVILFAFSNIFLIILILSSAFLIPTNINVSDILLSILVIFGASVWEIPVFLLISRKTNLFSSILFAFFGILLGAFISTSRWNYLIPFNWPIISVSPIIKMNINGIPFSQFENINFSPLGIMLSLVTFITIMILDAYSFKYQGGFNEKNK